MLIMSLVDTQTVPWGIPWPLFSKGFEGHEYNAVFGEIPLTKMPSRSKCSC